MSELVRYHAEHAIATLTLDSPRNRNAMSAQLAGDLRAHFRAAAADEQVRAVVLTHSGRTFCSGADLKEQASEGGPAEGTQRMLDLLRAIIEMPKPVIARVDGHVRAGGLGLVGACDIAVAGPSASFAFTEVRLALAPAIISLTTLHRMSERAAARYYLTGEVFDAAAAASAGLVTSAVHDVDDEVATICDALRAGAPQGLAESKALTTRATLARFDDDAERLRALSQRLFESDQAAEGMRAFLDKRPPGWVGPE
jgi:enoyl-CoA hydratase